MVEGLDHRKGELALGTRAMTTDGTLQLGRRNEEDDAVKMQYDRAVLRRVCHTPSRCAFDAVVGPRYTSTSSQVIYMRMK